ncbi:DUF680 domain-containing protein [Mesorhizobium sp. B2-4-19]|uniref:DUF680 domain-containing protein n=1 Tax=Mesorhizobium sp. B2-4-19 TaxID=2589930 RepID=UPI00112AC486|nr:DUF680 domain-containing protein [Mesorhizobium sp. B2-4-19]TPK68027.1 DUF680 domain-containing protein [Mesorhizobium sp. B2-4-19]
MKKIILAAAAVLAISGSAFAGNDNVGWTDINKQAATNVDTSHTGAIRDSGSFVHKLLNSSGGAQNSAPQSSDRDLYGSR